MTPSKTLFYLCASFIIGVSLQSSIKIPQIILWGFLISATLFIIFSALTGKNNFTIIGFCILLLVLGIARLQVSEFNISQDELKNFNNKPEEIILIGEVIGKPDIRETTQKLKVKIDDTNSTILITTQRYPAYKYLDKIRVVGKLKSPAVFDGFNYKNYLMKDGIYSVMDFPEIELVFPTSSRILDSETIGTKEHDYNFFTFLYDKTLFFKEKLMGSINKNFPSPQDSILQGLVFGNDKNMPKDLKNRFNATGLSHLTAVSGSNIVILIEVLMVFLLALGFWRGQAFYFSIILMWIYILMIGLPASGVRAAIMGSMVLLAQKLGRQNTSSRTITIAAVIMLFQNPLLLFYDISFQLSFLASMGIIYLKPILDNLIQFNREPFKKSGFKALLDIISVTFAAQIFTLPIIVYNFGNISLISPITNVLALPIIPLLTILGFLVSVFGIISDVLGFILSIPCWPLLFYFTKILDIFSKPWAVKIIPNVSWIWPIIYYFTLIILTWFLGKKQKSKFLGY